MSQQQQLVNVGQLLQSRVKDYIPSAYFGGAISFRNRPIFSQYMINEMLIEPRVGFGLYLIKGPMLTKAKFEIISSNSEVAEFADDMINRFWLNGASQALKAIEWGYSGSETLYEQDQESGRIVYKSLKDFESPSVKVVTKNGCRTGILVSNFLTMNMNPARPVYLGGMKCFHHVHWRHFHPWYGRSRLTAVAIPYNEKWSEGGYRDIRRMWFYKNAFEGGTMYHPQGYYKLPDGRLRAYQDLAQELIEKKRAGATLTLPSTIDSRSGQRLWEHEPAKGNTIPSGLFDYGDDLDSEILEALGIPYEVIEASGNEGFGSSSGRAIPETAFYSILQEHLNWLVLDFNEQILTPLIQLNAALGLLPFAVAKVLAKPLEAVESSPEGGQEGSFPGSPDDEGIEEGSSEEGPNSEPTDDDEDRSQNDDTGRIKKKAKKTKPKLSLSA